MKTETELLDDEGENQAVRCFLMQYGAAGLTVGGMQMHMRRCGFPHWPEWVEPRESARQHLTKAGAQQWLRHLFALEPATRPESDAALLRQAAEALEEAAHLIDSIANKALSRNNSEALSAEWLDEFSDVAASLRAALEKKP